MPPFSKRSGTTLVSKQAKRQQRFGAGALFFMGLIFFLLGATGSYFVLVAPILRINDAQNWTTTTCHITESFLETSSGDDGDTYRPAVRYTFSFDGKPFSGDTFDFSTGYTSGRQTQQSRLDPVPVGADVPCYVNPSNPDESVIFRDLGWSILLPGLIVLIFPLVGLGILYASYRMGFAKAQTERGGSTSNASLYLSPSMSGGSNSSERLLGLPETVQGPKTHESSPFMRLFAAIFIACFWNGIVSIFAYQFVADWNRGSADWFLGLFLLPFLAVGIGLLVFVGYSFLGLFNPRLSFELSPHPAPLGDSIQVTWKIKSGSPSSLEDLRFILEGKEIVRYRRGTSTATDSNVFFTKDLRSLQPVEIQMREGRFQFAVPEHLIPTLSVPNNEIVWTLKCQGKIKNWPDISEDITFTVYPLRR